LVAGALLALFALSWFSSETASAQASQRPIVSPLPASDYSVRPVCAAPAPGHASCLALELVPVTSAARAYSRPLGMARRARVRVGKAVEVCKPPTAAEGCYGLRPQDLHSAYGLPTMALAEQTIVLVDAYDDPSAEADLKMYDEAFHLPPCTTANGCFTKVNEKGRTSPLPATEGGWAVEISLDIEVAHATCQNCRIVLVEANDSTYVSLDAAEETAAARLGATEISNSWGGGEPVTDSAIFDHPGVVITAASGDFGYLNWDAPNPEARGFVGYPASSPHVVAVGGTHLSLTPEGGWAGETVWNNGSTLEEGNGAGGGGCSVRFAAAPWQQELPNWPSVGCESNRAVNDVSADADPYTGVAVYDSTPPESGSGALGWLPLGGTSLTSPLIASSFALAGGAAGMEYPAKTLYENLVKHPAALHDVTSGSNGECSKPFNPQGLSGCTTLEEQTSCSSNAICLAGPGYDGPSGVGTPNGIGAFKPASELVKKTQLIEFTSNAPGSATVGPIYAVSATASSGLTVSFSSGTPSVCLIASSTVRFVAVGTCTIDANQSGNANYDAAPQVQQSVAVGKGSQVIEFTSNTPPWATLKGAFYYVSATASSGLAVSFSSWTPSVCSVSGLTVSFIALGTCTVDANQAGNANYEAAPEAQQSFAVNKSLQIIQFYSSVPGSATVGGSTYTVGATATSGLAVSFSSATPSVCSLAGSTVSFIATGTCAVDANQAGNSEYAPAAQEQQSFAVSKNSQHIEFTSSAPGSATIGGPVYAVAVTATSGLAVSLSSGTPSVCSLSGATVRFIAAGTCTVDGNQAGDASYQAAPEAQQSFTVGKHPQLVTFTSSAPSPATVGGPVYAVSATASSKLVVALSSGTPSVCSLAGSIVSFVAVGTCTIDANQAGNGEYGAAPETQQSFAVSRRSQVIEFTSSPPGSATVGGAFYSVSATATSGLALLLSSGSPAVCSVAGSTVSLLAVGICTIDANQTGNSEYDAALEVQQSFAVGSGPVLVSMPSLTPALTSSPTLALMPPFAATPDSNFSLLRNPIVNPKTGAITFSASVGDPGTFSWLLTFPNGKPGAFSAGKTKCKTGQVRLNGKCRPAKVVFGRGSKVVAAGGIVSFTVSPSAAAKIALENALKKGRSLSVTATLTFQSSRGGAPASNTRSITDTLKKMSEKGKK
jgi:hypothetical protein